MLRFLRRLVCPDTDTADGQALVAPGTTTRHVDGDPTAHLTIRQTDALTDRHGRVPEEVAATAIAAALGWAGLGGELTYGYESIDVGTEAAGCADGDARDRYEQRIGEFETARDANLLLTDATGGGCAQWWDKRTAAVGARNLSTRRAVGREGTGDYHSAIQALLHELGHCLGAHHDHDDATAGNQHPGMAWVDGRQYRYTPTVFGGGAANRCGEPVPPEPPNAEMIRVHEYSDCAVALFERSLRDRGD